VLKHTHPSFLGQLTSYTQKLWNRSFDAWLFEFDFLHHVRRRTLYAVPLLNRGPGAMIEFWQSPAYIEFDTASDIRITHQIQNGCWLIPISPTNPGYHALQLLYEEETLRFVQCSSNLEQVD